MPLLIFANKNDLLTALEIEEIEEEMSLSNINDRDWNIISCSATEQNGLQEGIEWIEKTVIAWLTIDI